MADNISNNLYINVIMWNKIQVIFVLKTYIFNDWSVGVYTYMVKKIAISVTFFFHTLFLTHT